MQWVAPLASESPGVHSRGTAGDARAARRRDDDPDLIEGQPVDAADRQSAAGVQHFGRDTRSADFDSRQSEEVFLTAAQSLFAVAILVSLSI